MKFLSSLLERNRNEFHIEYGGYLSNHMSHALIALYQLGAPPERLQSWFDTYSRSLEPRVPPTPDFKITTENWQKYVGKKQHYAEYVDFFTNQVNQQGLNSVMSQYVPVLLDGLSSGAFHHLINLGYALEIDDEANAAESLAYWAYGQHSLGPLKQDLHVTNMLPSLLETTKLIRNDRVFDRVSNKIGFQSTLNALTGDSQLLSALYKYLVRFHQQDTNVEELVQRLCIATIELFLFTGCRDFFLVHLVTSMRALKNVLQRLTDRAFQLRSLELYWRALLATYIVQQRHEMKVYSIPATPELNWDSIIKRTLPVEEEHIIKCVFVCNQYEKEFATGQNELATFLRYAANQTVETVNRKGWQY